MNWLSKTGLRNYFSKNIVFDNLSLWWLTNLIEKDNLNDPLWYNNLHKKLNKEKSIPKKFIFSILL